MKPWSKQVTNRITRVYRIELESSGEEVEDAYFIRSFDGSYNLCIVTTEEGREATKTNDRVPENDLSSVAGEENSECHPSQKE